MKLCFATTLLVYSILLVKLQPKVY